MNVNVCVPVTGVAGARMGGNPCRPYLLGVCTQVVGAGYIPALFAVNVNVCVPVTGVAGARVGGNLCRPYMLGACSRL